MPEYAYRCDCGIESAHTYDIGTAPRQAECPVCARPADLVIGAGVQIAPSALETKGHVVRIQEEMEDRWGKDMPAYRRMRNAGMQPKGIDGCAKLENEVGGQLEINHHALMQEHGVTREELIEKAEMAQEIMAEGIVTA